MKYIWLLISLLILSVLADCEQAFAQKCDTLTFRNGEDTLRGYFFNSNRRNLSPTVLLLQGLPGTVGDVLDLGEYLSGYGINLFTFNYSGIYGSTGKHSLANTIQDIDAALAFLMEETTAAEYEIDTSRIILGGYSFGGGMALTYLQHHPGVKRVFSIAGTDHGQFAQKVVTDSVYLKTMSDYFTQYLQAPAGPVRFLYNNPIDELLDRSDYFHNKILAHKLAMVDVLLIGALDDRNVTMENHLLPLYRALRQNVNQKVRFVIYQTTHSFAGRRSQLGSDIRQWIDGIESGR